jgi:hypothetical protein
VLKLTRRALLGAASPFAAAAAWGRWEAQSLRVEKRELAPRDGSPGQPRIRLLQLSDFHSSLIVPDSLIDEAIERGAELRPDLLCATGDFVSFAAPVSGRFRDQLRRMARIAPAFAVLGNHDGGRWAAEKQGSPSSEGMRHELTACGFRVLHNEHDLAIVNGRRLRLVGVGDRWADEVDGAAAFRGVDSGEEIVLLAHNPDTKMQVADFPWRLMLSGHTHGGQLRLPWNGATPYAPVNDHRYVDGLRRWGGRWIQVSRGVGNVKGLRFNCPPEINLLEL